MSELSCASLERIMRAAGAKRVSASAVVLLSEALEDFGAKVSREAVELASHAGRKTVKKEDVKLAVRRLGNGLY
jgi:histone H3/H4